MIEKLDLISKDNLKENIEKLAELFPNCITESVDSDGNLKKSVDFDLLKQELSSEIVEGYQERYTLNWPGKKEAILRANSPISKTLRPDREDSVEFDKTKNLFIEGDNEDALKLLQENYLGAVKMIYIDPPYNTGKDFIYPDDFAESRDEYLEKSNQVDDEGNRMVANTDANGRFHSDWLSMMYSRLKLSRNLLRDDGVIFISIDDNEVHNLRKICDEIFGAGNFVAKFPWKGRGGGADDKNLLNNHEYVLFFVKNIQSFSVGRKIKKNEVFPKIDDSKNMRYKTQLARKWGSNSRREDRPNLFYSIKAPNGESFYPKLPNGDDGCWRWSKTRMEKAINNNDLEFRVRKDSHWEAYEKIYEPQDGENRTKLYSAWLQEEINEDITDTLQDEESKSTAFGTKQLKELFEGKAFFDYPKPTNLLSILLKIANSHYDDITLDFFAGSATTAHAVMKLNAEDGGNRKFILVQLPEKCDEKSEAFKAKYKTIAEISKERIRRAGKKIKEENPETSKDLDIGFRVLKVDTSNMKDTYYKPKEINQQQIAGLISNIKEDRTDEDLLFQVMLDSGVQLDLEITTEEIMGKKVYFVAANSLCACFETNLPEGLFSELAKREPVTLVLKDSSFVNNDALKTNVEQIFRQLSPETELKVI
jgi:adenine-specific DNA-methyltransferase